jgi:2-desacetyl-2-hydroxyethyl bacteriochlorophyllide A dehydrogenase
MKVAVLTGAKKIEFTDKPKPVISPSEVLVKVEYCGISASDVHGYAKGNVIPPGTVMGREFSGVIVEAGEEVQNVELGSRVVVKPFANPENLPGPKKPILDMSQLLETTIGVSPKYDGAFAEYVRIPYPDEMLFVLPSEVSFQEAALVEPLSVSLHGLRLSSLKRSRIVVIGAGVIGLGVLQFLRWGGAGKIIVLEISPEKSEVAQRLGADIVLNPLTEGEKLVEKIFEFTDLLGADMVFECSGAQSALQNSIRYLKKGGQIIVIGFQETEISFDFSWMVHWEVDMKGSLDYDNNEFQSVIEFLEKKELNTEALITDIIPLHDLEEKGFKRLLSSPEVIKVLVKP